MDVAIFVSARVNIKLGKPVFPHRRWESSRALRTDLHSAVVSGGEDGDKAGNKELLRRLYNICH